MTLGSIGDANGSDATCEFRPSWGTALREQLGVALEAASAPVDVIVIDHVDRPTPN